MVHCVHFYELVSNYNRVCLFVGREDTKDIDDLIDAAHKNLRLSPDTGSSTRGAMFKQYGNSGFIICYLSAKWVIFIEVTCGVAAVRLNLLRVEFLELVIMKMGDNLVVLYHLKTGQMLLSLYLDFFRLLALVRQRKINYFIYLHLELEGIFSTWFLFDTYRLRSQWIHTTCSSFQQNVCSRCWNFLLRFFNDGRYDVSACKQLGFRFTCFYLYIDCTILF